jgi:hypothetical protein
MDFRAAGRGIILGVAVAAIVLGGLGLIGAAVYGAVNHFNARSHQAQP